MLAPIFNKKFCTSCFLLFVFIIFSNYAIKKSYAEGTYVPELINPNMVYLETKKGNSCTGLLIHPRVAITVATCIKEGIRSVQIINPKQPEFTTQINETILERVHVTDKHLAHKTEGREVKFLENTIGFAVFSKAIVNHEIKTSFRTNNLEGLIQDKETLLTLSYYKDLERSPPLFRRAVRPSPVKNKDGFLLTRTELNVANGAPLYDSTNAVIGFSAFKVPYRKFKNEEYNAYVLIQPHIEWLQAQLGIDFNGNDLSSYKGLTCNVMHKVSHKNLLFLIEEYKTKHNVNDGLNCLDYDTLVESVNEEVFSSLIYSDNYTTLFESGIDKSEVLDVYLHNINVNDYVVVKNTAVTHTNTMDVFYEVNQSNFTIHDYLKITSEGYSHNEALSFLKLGRYHFTVREYLDLRSRGHSHQSAIDYFKYFVEEITKCREKGYVFERNPKSYQCLDPEKIERSYKTSTFRCEKPGGYILGRHYGAKRGVNAYAMCLRISSDQYQYETSQPSCVQEGFIQGRWYDGGIGNRNFQKCLRIKPSQVYYETSASSCVEPGFIEGRWMDGGIGNNNFLKCHKIQSQEFYYETSSNECIKQGFVKGRHYDGGIGNSDFTECLRIKPDQIEYETSYECEEPGFIQGRGYDGGIGNSDFKKCLRITPDLTRYETSDSECRHKDFLQGQSFDGGIGEPDYKECIRQDHL